MFFRKHEKYQRSGGGILGIFRLILSIIVMLVLGLGLLQAYRAFSGIDPLKIDPKSLMKNVLTGDFVYKTVTGLLSFNPNLQFSSTKKMLGKSASPTPQTALSYKFAIVSDSHKDTQSLSKALKQAKGMGAKFVVGLGDFSDVGTIDELRSSKEQFDGSGMPYYVTAGDHDLWDSRDKKFSPDNNFKTVFGATYQSFAYESTRLIIVYNTDNYFGVDFLEMKWLEDEVLRSQNGSNRLTFVFLGTPLYHPSSDHVMGKVDPKLKNQADHMMSIFKKMGVEEVFAGDTHIFSRYTEPINDLKMTTVGAVTSARNPEAPRFVIVDIFTDGSYNVEDVEIH